MKDFDVSFDKEVIESSLKQLIEDLIKNGFVFDERETITLGEILMNFQIVLFYTE